MKIPASSTMTDGSGLVAHPRLGELVSWSLLKRYWPFYSLIFLIGTENFIVSPFIPEMARGVGVSVGALATVVTAYALTYAIAAPFLGQVSDRFGTKPLVTAGISVFIAGNVCFAISPSLELLLLSRAVTGLGGAAAGPAIWSYIAGSTREEMRGRAMGLGMGAFALGQVAGLPIGGAIASIVGWRWIFGGIGVLMVPLLASCFIQRKKLRSAAAGISGAKPFPLLAVWGSPAVVRAYVGTFLFQVGNLGSYTYLGSLLSAQFGLSTGQIGSIGILVGGGSFLGSFAGGKLNDLWRKRGGTVSHLAAFWSLVLAVSVFAATSGQPFAISLIAITLWFVASGGFVTTQLALITLAAPAMRATALSWNNSIMFAGAGAGVWLMGEGMLRGISVGTVGLWFGLAAASATLCFSRFQRNSKEENRS